MTPASSLVRPSQSLRRMVERVGQIWPHLALHAAAGLAPARACRADALDHGIRPYWNYLKRQNAMDMPRPARACSPAPQASAPPGKPLLGDSQAGTAARVAAPYAPPAPGGRLIDLVA